MAGRESARERGGKAEIAAREYLERAGMTFVEANYHDRQGEIDLVFMDGTTLVLVEVKYRKKNAHIEIEESINRAKVNRILKCAETYIGARKPVFGEMRLDALMIEEDASGKRDIRHYRDFY